MEPETLMSLVGRPPCMHVPGLQGHC